MSNFCILYTCVIYNANAMSVNKKTILHFFWNTTCNIKTVELVLLRGSIIILFLMLQLARFDVNFQRTNAEFSALLYVNYDEKNLNNQNPSEKKICDETGTKRTPQRTQNNVQDSPQSQGDTFKRSGARASRRKAEPGEKPLLPPILQENGKKYANSVSELRDKMGEFVEMITLPKRTIHKPMRDLVDLLAVLQKQHRSV
uniref:Uncharacterized protein n=1 Tax=Glossina pallidipes TaxID=7398 RepID=A0A1A9ZNY2_GLOPL